MINLRDALASLLSYDIDAVRATPVSGGCISDAQRVRVTRSSGESEDLFVKSNSADFLDNFRAEWEGLKLLHAAGAIRVPSPLAIGTANHRAWIVLEWIEPGCRSADFFDHLGRQLAELHRATSGTRIGLDHDNFLGSARQINEPSEDWLEFIADRRIGFQLRWGIDQGLIAGTLKQDVTSIMNRLPELLAGGESTTCLLHGDLWSGNYLCDESGSPVLIDPAVWYGNREAEFGMLRLFGSCPESFYRSYDAAFPLPGGWQRRVNVYVLYHLLNHLNLFGHGYHGQCCAVASEVLQS